MTFTRSLSMTMFYSIDLLLETELETVNWREECHLVTVTPSVEQEPNSDRHIQSQGDKKWSAYYTHYYFRPKLYHFLILLQTIRATFTAIGIRICLQFNITSDPLPALTLTWFMSGRYGPQIMFCISMYFITSDSFTQKYETCDRLAQQLVF